MEVMGNQKKFRKKWWNDATGQLNRKTDHFRYIYIREYGKKAKKRVFGNFDPDNRITKKNDLSYLVGNFATNPKMVSLFYQK